MNIDDIEKLPWKPMSVYYLHFEDDRGALPNWNKCKDYVCCVMARTQKEAIDVTRYIALNQKNAKEIKILGIGHCKEDWTLCEQPMTTDEQAMRAQLDAMFDRIQSKS